jgi:predicted nucleotidyltransferase
MSLDASGDERRILAEIVRRILSVADPDRIILFGSRAAGSAAPGSDYDILIIADSDLPRWRRTPPIYDVLGGLGVPKDVVWWTPEEVVEWRNTRAHFVTRATREGRVLYERAS